MDRRTSSEYSFPSPDRHLASVASDEAPHMCSHLRNCTGAAVFVGPPLLSLRQGSCVFPHVSSSSQSVLLVRGFFSCCVVDSFKNDTWKTR